MLKLLIMPLIVFFSTIILCSLLMLEIKGYQDEKEKAILKLKQSNENLEKQISKKLAKLRQINADIKQISYTLRGE